MRTSEATFLLSSGVAMDADGIRIEALTRKLGEWPLLLRLVNRQLHELLRDGLDLDGALREIEDDLEESGVTAFDVEDDTAREKAVERTLVVSLKRLADNERKSFQELAVFPEDVDVPLDVLERFWGRSKRETLKLCKRLYSLALLVRFERSARTLRLHDVVRQYLVDELEAPAPLHQQLLERCRPPSGRWADLKDGDTYLWHHLAEHLDAASDRAELRSLLFDLDYLEGKLRTMGANALLADYDVLNEPGEPLTVQEALRLSAHVLSRDLDGKLLGQQLAGQLLGRLGQVGEEGRRLLKEAAARTLLRPRRVRMSRIGGPLIRTLEGHTSGITAVAVLDTQRVVSASKDHTLRVWDVVSGEMLRTLKGHTFPVVAVAVLGDRRVVSASYKTLNVWGIESGEMLRTLQGHTSGVTAVAVLDARRVVSASDDQTLRVWDVESGDTLCTLEGHTASVEAVAVLDAQRVVSASKDRTLRVWDVKSGDTLRTLEGHTFSVTAVAVLDARRVVSASNDRTLRVWDVESGNTLRTLKGQPTQVHAVAVLDAQRVISASDDKALLVWDVESSEMLRTLQGHTSFVTAVTVLGCHVVSASSDHTLRVWNVESSDMLHTLQGHINRVTALAVLDTRRVVSASDDKTLRVWDAESGEAVRTLQGHTDCVRAVAVLGARRVVSASDDETRRVWGRRVRRDDPHARRTHLHGHRGGLVRRSARDFSIT